LEYGCNYKFNPVSPTVNTTYTATCTDFCGVSPSGSFPITVNPLPTVPSISQTGTKILCPRESFSLNASGCNGSTITWSNSVVGSSITVNSANTYAATCTNVCGTSTASSPLVVLNVSNNLTLSGNASSSLSHASQSITSSQTINNGINVAYQAGNNITLNPDFISDIGSTFNVDIGATCPITDGLVLHLPFNGNANDISGGNNNGITNNVSLTTDRNGKANSAYYFNGTNAFIRIPNNPSLSGGTELTLSVWIKPEDLNGTLRGIITKWYQTASSDTYAMLIASTNQILAAVNGNPEIYSGIISANNWIQIVYTHSSTLDKIYINGILVSTINVSRGVATTTIPIIIGADSNNGTIWRFFKGKIDEVKIYNRALTVQEIEYQYNVESIPADINTGLVAYYNMDNNVNDQSGNGHHTTFTNTTVTTGRKGNVNGAYSFNGINQSIHLGTWFRSQEFTISMWLNASPTQPNAYAMIFDNNHGYNISFSAQQDFNTTNQYYFAVGGTPTYGYTGFSLIPNQWEHIVLIKGNGFIKVYKNGNLLGSATHSGLIDYTSTTPALCLGAYVNNGNNIRYWAGKMDDVKIYNRALSDVEVGYLNAE
jgi:hypothetical protein